MLEDLQLATAEQLFQNLLKRQMPFVAVLPETHPDFLGVKVIAANMELQNAISVLSIAPQILIAKSSVNFQNEEFNGQD